MQDSFLQTSIVSFDSASLCYVNGVATGTSYPGFDISASLLRNGESVDASSDIVIVENTDPDKSIVFRSYSWAHGLLDITDPTYEPHLSVFTVSGTSVEPSAININWPRYLGDMERTTDVDVVLPPGKSLSLSLIVFPSNLPAGAPPGSLNVSYYISDKTNHSTFTNTYVEVTESPGGGGDAPPPIGLPRS